jgi:hypothetical protein
MNSLTHFGTYDHSDRNLLIVGSFIFISLIIYIINKYLK